MRGSLAAKQRVGEEPRGHLEMLEGSVAIQTRAVSGLGTQMCGPGRRQGGLEMRDEEEGGVRRDSDNETEAQRGLVMGPQPHSQGVKPQARHLYEAAAWPAALAAAPPQRRPWSRGEGSGAASSRCVHGLCSVPGVMEIDQGICQGMRFHSVLPAAH